MIIKMNFLKIDYHKFLDKKMKKKILIVGSMTLPQSLVQFLS